MTDMRNEIRGEIPMTDDLQAQADLMKAAAGAGRSVHCHTHTIPADSIPIEFVVTRRQERPWRWTERKYRVDYPERPLRSVSFDVEREYARVDLEFAVAPEPIACRTAPVWISCGWTAAWWLDRAKWAAAEVWRDLVRLWRERKR